jgi:hypothetical protein
VSTATGCVKNLKDAYLVRFDFITEVVMNSYLDSLTHAGFLLGLLIDLEDNGDMFLRNVSSLHGVISQKIKLLHANFNAFEKIFIKLGFVALIEI